MTYLRPFDPHVHLRGEEYADYDFLAKALDDANDVGLCGMLEMPNPVPWLTSAGRIANRVRTFKSRFPQANYLYHGINIGLTNDKAQVEDALALVANKFMNVTADKIFYTHSTGNMGILDPEMQHWIWATKARLGYKGVSIGHFEDERQYIGAFTAKHPPSHSTYQRPEAETTQVENQLRSASDVGFEGVFYIAHCSVPETVKLVERMRPSLRFRIVIEATWHHMFLNAEQDYKIHGNRVKMNPPLRPKALQEELLAMVLAGRIDIIGTDHAPHPLHRKDDQENPASGVPAILFWPKGIELLRKHGITEDSLAKITCWNALDLFLPRPKPRSESVKVAVETIYQPEKWAARYGYNPFSRYE